MHAQLLWVSNDGHRQQLHLPWQQLSWPGLWLLLVVNLPEDGSWFLQLFDLQSSCAPPCTRLCVQLVMDKYLRLGPFYVYDYDRDNSVSTSPSTLSPKTTGCVMMGP